jgi:MFS family permease
MTGAALGDRFGRRRVFVSGLGLFAGASVACALAPDAGWLIAARVQGAALVWPLALALLSVAFPPELRPKALGFFAGVSGLAVPVGPLFGGRVVEGVSWPWIFWLNVPIALLLIPSPCASWKRAVESTRRSTSPGWRSSRVAPSGSSGA